MPDKIEMDAALRIRDIFQLILATNLVGDYYDIKVIRIIVHKLATINKGWNNNFNNEDNAKFLISLLVNNNPGVRTHYGIAKYLGSSIANKIKTNFDQVINRKEVNIIDPWYGNATISLSH